MNAHRYHYLVVGDWVLAALLVLLVLLVSPLAAAPGAAPGSQGGFGTTVVRGR